jgi:spore coat protein U domain-containing protein, fimbrial subunit CupE1/2/3/6
LIRLLIAAILLLLGASAACAAVSCTVQVADLNFGTIDTLGPTGATTSTDVTIDCSGSSANKVTLCGNIGAGTGGASGGLREMPGSPALDFGLYTSPGTSQPWGSTSTPALGAPYQIPLPVTDGNAGGTVQLHGLIPTGQGTVAAGSYSSEFSSADVDFKYADGDLDCSNPAGALDASDDFTVLATVPANCLLVTHDLDFGTHGLIGSEIDAETNMDITCTPSTSYTISIDGGGSGDPDNRLMHSGADSVRYGLYSDAQRTAVWGTDPGTTVSGTGTGSQDQPMVYGRIPPQTAAPGHYSDTVVVTISY